MRDERGEADGGFFFARSVRDLTAEGTADEKTERQDGTTGRENETGGGEGRDAPVKETAS